MEGSESGEATPRKHLTPRDRETSVVAPRPIEPRSRKRGLCASSGIIGEPRDYRERADGGNGMPIVSPDGGAANNLRSSQVLR